MEDALDSVEIAPNSQVPLDSVDVLVSEVPDSVEEVLDSVEIAPNSLMPPDSVDVLVEEVPDSVEEVPDVDQVVHCGLCGTFHAGGVSTEECRQARREARRCSRCGLLHEDYHVPARFFHQMKEFDCEVYIPDVEKLEMRGNTILLPDLVVKKLEEHLKKVQN